jgi:hypothetical protein
MFREYLHRRYQALIRNRKRRAPRTTPAGRLPVAHLTIEGLEDRCVPSIDMVTNPGGSAATPGSLPYWVVNAAPGDTIQFAANLNGHTIYTLGHSLYIQKNLTIDGAGRGITVDSGGLNKAVVIEPNKVVAINGLTITGGSDSGILNYGSLALSNSTVTGNYASSGGGIYNANSGTMTMSGDTVNNNTATGFGGGVYNDGQLTIINCTIAANNANQGGGIFNNAVLKMANSTVASNTVTGAGADGGGIYRGFGAGSQLSLLNTIVSNPNSGAATKDDVFREIAQAQGDLFGSTVSIASGGDLGGNQENVNPQLGPLQNNGGPTATMALLPGSPAIGTGAGTSQIAGLSVPTTDQRGDPRPATSIDVGAFQVQAAQAVPTTTALASALNPAPLSQPVMLTATVHATGQASATPTGMVTFLDGATGIGTATLSNGVATLTTSTLTAGTHSITAMYQGATQGAVTFTASTSTPLVETVVQPTVSTMTALASALNPAQPGMPVTFTATVSATTAGAGTPTGTATFLDGTTSLGTATLSNGVATLTTSTLTAGAHSITAMYHGTTQGASTFTASTSMPLVETVVQPTASTLTVLASALNPAQPGMPVTFTATVSATTAGAGTPTGMVTFLDGSTSLGTATLGNGVATLTTATLGLGQHAITALYHGATQAGTTFDPSTSAPLVETVRFTYFAVAGAPGRVQVRRDSDGRLLADFQPFGAAYTAGVCVATADVNGDGAPDLIVAATAGNPDVRVYDGKAFANGTFNAANPNASLLAQFFPYALNLNLGANVAAGDIEHTGYADIVTGATAGNPDVRVYRGQDIAQGTFDPNGKSLLAHWFPYALQFNVGANVAVGDVNGDGYADVVTGATAGNPDVRVYSGQDIAHGTFDPAGKSALAQFFAYGLNYNVGAFVAVGDTTGSGFGDIITGASAGNPDVHVYNGQAIAKHTFDPNHPEASLRDQFFAYGLDFDIGAAVASADFEGSGKFDVLTGTSAGSPHYRVVKGNATGVQPPALLEGLPSDLQGGVAVGA